MRPAGLERATVRFHVLPADVDVLGLQKAEVAVDQIRTIDRGRLLRRISVLTKDESVQLRRIISDTYC